MNIKTRSIPAALAAATITILTLGGAASGCQSQQGATGEGGTTDHILKSCATKITQKPSRVGRSRTVEAATHSECDRPPIRHTVLITLQYHPGNGSQYVTMGTKYCEAIPVRGIPTDCHATFPGICHVGTWRMTVLITGTGPNGAPFSFPLDNKPTVKIKSCA